MVHEHFPRQEITDAEASSGVKVKVKCKYCQKTLYHANCEDLKLHLRREHYQAYLEVEKGDENALEERRKRLYAASDNATATSSRGLSRRRPIKSILSHTLSAVRS